MLFLDELIRADEGFLVNDTIIVEVDIPEGATFAKYRTLLSDIQNLLKEKTCEKEASSSSQEIDDVADVIETEQKIELKKAFSTMSRVSDREKEAVSPVTKFIAEFDQTCEQYAVAQEDIEAAKEKEKRWTTLLKLAVDMMDPLRERVVDTMDPLRERAKKIEREIDEHKRILQVKEARKARIMEYLESLSVTLRRSQLLLDEANQNLKQFMPKKEEAQNKMDDTEKLWESLKSHFKHLF